MEVFVSNYKRYEMDEQRILSEPSFNPPSPDATDEEKETFLRESFYELCGDWRNEDHIDGKYVWLVSDDGEADFDWPKSLTKNEEAT